jgi:hypothetical protein
MSDERPKGSMDADTFVRNFADAILQPLGLTHEDIGYVEHGKKRAADLDWQRDRAFVDWIMIDQDCTREEALALRYGMADTYAGWRAGATHGLRCAVSVLRLAADTLREPVEPAAIRKLARLLEIQAEDPPADHVGSEGACSR